MKPENMVVGQIVGEVEDPENWGRPYEIEHRLKYHKERTASGKYQRETTSIGKHPKQRKI
jgi:hypothetical protein